MTAGEGTVPSFFIFFFSVFLFRVLLQLSRLAGEFHAEMTRCRRQGKKERYRVMREPGFWSVPFISVFCFICLFVCGLPNCSFSLLEKARRKER